MQLLLGILIAAAIGFAVHYALPQKLTRGIALAPLLAAAVGAISWTALTWAGLGADTPLPWIAAIVLPALVTIPAVVGLGAARVRSDAETRERLRIR